MLSVTVDDIEIAVAQQGDSGQAVLLVHGLGAPQPLGRAMAVTAAVVTPLAALALYRVLAPFRESARGVTAT